MGRYVVIASRDTIASNETTWACELAARVAANGHDVTVFLVHDGVLAARQQTAVAPAMRALAARATVLVDEPSLRQRGISVDELMLGITPSDVDELAELVTAPGCVAWWN